MRTSASRWVRARLAVGLLVTALAVVPIPCTAQGPGSFEVVGGTTFLGSSDVVDGYGPGWLVAGGWHATRWLAFGFELDRSSQAQGLGLLDLDASFLSLLAGLRVSTRFGTLRPIAQVFAGQTQVNLVVRSEFPFASRGDFFERHTAVQLGGGVDLPVERGFSVRIAFDYRRVYAPDAFAQRRVVIAAVYTFGGR